MFFNFALHLYMTLSSADNPFKQFGPRSGPFFVQALSRFRMFGTLEVKTS